MKVIDIVKNDHITGIEYGLVEIPDHEIANIKNVKNTKQSRVKQQYAKKLQKMQNKIITAKHNLRTRQK